MSQDTQETKESPRGGDGSGQGAESADDGAVDGSRSPPSDPPIGGNAPPRETDSQERQASSGLDWYNAFVNSGLLVAAFFALWAAYSSSLNSAEDVTSALDKTERAVRAMEKLANETEAARREASNARSVELEVVSRAATAQEGQAKALERAATIAMEDVAVAREAYLIDQRPVLRVVSLAAVPGRLLLLSVENVGKSAALTRDVRLSLIVSRAGQGQGPVNIAADMAWQRIAPGATHGFTFMDWTRKEGDEIFATSTVVYLEELDQTRTPSPIVEMLHGAHGDGAAETLRPRHTTLNPAR